MGTPGPSARPPVPLPPQREVDLPGRGSTFVRDSGPYDGPTIVLLHGWLATADLNWFGCYAPLERDHRVLALDHRGHGRGIRSRKRFTLADCADDVAALIAVERCGPVIAVGYSMGGPVAQLLWYRHSALVAGLVLCATSRNFRGRAGERVAFGALAGASTVSRALPPGARRRLRGLFREHVTGAQFGADTPQGAWAREEFGRSDGRMLLEAGSALGRFSSHAWIGGVDVPTAVVVTEQDRLVRPTRQHKLAGAIPRATVHSVEGDHVVVASDPERFAPVLVDACRDVARRAEQVSSAG